MDNLAHSFVGAVVGAALAPALAHRHRRRLLLTSALIANLPDCDILLMAISKDTYIFHHRGFTHSLVGLALLLPLALLLFVTLMGRKRLAEAGQKIDYRPWAFFVLVQLVFSHFTLDFFTSYGTMFLYPFSWRRFSFPLMFILDPALWLVAGLGFLWLFYKDLDGERGIAKVAWGTLAAVALLWTGEYLAKRQAERHYSQYDQKVNGQSPGEVQSYPAPLAPFFWLLLEKQRLPALATTPLPGDEPATLTPAVHYKQAAISYIGKKGNGVVTWWQEPIPASYRHGAFCNDRPYSQEAIAEFKRFVGWAEHAVCSPYQWEGQEGCRCLSLKYSLLALGGVAYGAYWIPSSGPGTFLPPESRDLLYQAYGPFLPLPL